ncbi:ABC transporter substrate-binding protein [Terasakiella sp. A23]|uniref:ABC transporter substrate-binding protein n=1 Tax=Terasakiella sp. FCG-A23 TaxID=3080561 RepID=UPI002953B081|nr:ABC transporter substrate-binding protein [Terasakiella sp. A23]MDV7340352.1 ABC transporter substrate-binding protein [Terasakiella sp. A23]
MIRPAAFFCAALCTLPALADDKPFDIFMVQWRGDTQTDVGFKNFFESSRIPANFTVRNPAQDKAAFPKIIAEIKAQKPDLVYTWSMASARGIDGQLTEDNLENYIQDIPIVNCMVSDPVVAGIATDWGKTNRNFTGVSHVPSIEAQLKAMKRYQDVKKLSIVYNTQQSSSNNAALELAELAKSGGIDVQLLPLSLNEEGKTDPADIAVQVEKASQFKPDFLYIGPDSFLYVNRDPLFNAVNKHKLATFTPSDVFLVKGDALFGLVGSYYVAGQYCGYKAAQILTQDKAPGDIPFDRLRNFSTKVNMSAAHHLKLYPPMDMLAITEVIKTEK